MPGAKALNILYSLLFPDEEALSCAILLPMLLLMLFMLQAPAALFSLKKIINAVDMTITVWVAKAPGGRPFHLSDIFLPNQSCSLFGVDIPQICPIIKTT
eukprot:1139477-Pelagomonas_calceolata.AAC.10